jgi:hypothetical protein
LADASAHVRQLPHAPMHFYFAYIVQNGQACQ